MAIFIVSRNSVNLENALMAHMRTLVRFRSTQAAPQEFDESGFRILDLKVKRSTQQPQQRRKREQVPIRPPRTEKMAVDQKWQNVWPGPRTFHPASVPLPVRQGVNKLGAAPSKWGNAELMKIPNFLHLTPPAVKSHCEALKKFCTPWPQGLETEEDMKKHFPMEVITSDYCHSSPTIRDPLSRIVSIKFPLSRLKFDKHSKDKFLRLVGEKYDETTDTVTIVTDKCPLRKQNYDYALYLLTAVYHESWITEPWESEKIEDDMEYYDWDRSKSKENTDVVLKATNQDDLDVTDLKEATVNLFDEGENEYNWNKYSDATKRILFPDK